MRPDDRPLTDRILDALSSGVDYVILTPAEAASLSKYTWVEWHWPQRHRHRRIGPLDDPRSLADVATARAKIRLLRGYERGGGRVGGGFAVDLTTMVPRQSSQGGLRGQS